MPQKEKKKKKKNQREKYQMNIDLNKRLKQHQENYYPAKKIEK